MFRNLKNSRLGKYYSSVCAKYGKIAPFGLAFIAFIAIYAMQVLDIAERVKNVSTTVYTVSIVVLAVCAAIVLYHMVTKLVSRKTTSVDLMLFVDMLVAVMILIQVLFTETSTAYIVTYIVAVVLIIVFTIARMAMVRPIAEPVKSKVEANSNFKSYFAALIKRFDMLLLAAVGLAILAAVTFAEALGLTTSESLQTGIIIIVAIVALGIILCMPKRLKSKRMGHVDAAVSVLLCDAVLYAIPFALTSKDGIDVARLVVWLVAFAILACFECLLIFKTYVEETSKEEEESGDVGFKVYFKQLASRYNLIFATAFALLGFVAFYAAASFGVIDRLATSAAISVYAMIALFELVLLVALLFGALRRRVGANDVFTYVLLVFSVLALIPAIQFYSVVKLVCVIELIVVSCVVIVLRSRRVADVKIKDAEEYNPAKLLTKDNCKDVAKSVKKVFVAEKDSHYISRKESRRIAKENMSTIKEYEKRKKRKNVPESEYVTKMRDDNNVVEFDNLHTYFFSDAGVVKAVNGVSFDIPQGSTVGVIGESGCGKSVTSMSLMQLVQAPKGQIINDEKIHSEIRFKSTVYKTDENGKTIPIYEVQLDENGNEMTDENGNPVYVTAPKLDKKGNPVLDKAGNPIMEKVQKRDEEGIPLFETEEKVYNVAKMPTEVMRKIRGREITMIFQEPMTSLNPIFTIGNQLDEVVLLHIPGATKESAKARTFEMLRLVGIIPENVYDRYPHELSGGMRQRVVIAMALSCRPKLIIADEPTTALDVTIQAQVLDLLRDIKKKINGSIMFITHDLGVIAEMADFVVVMYAGRVIEMGTAKEVFDNPLHPYTMGLQKSKPAVNKKVDRLYSIPGNVPNPINMPNYCYFRDRCDKRCDKCAGDYPEMIQVSPTHKVSCHLYEKED